MANNIGTLIIASIRPFTTTDTIATAYANEVKGGFHTVADDTERDALITTYPDRLEEGMVVNVLSSALAGGVRHAYQLSGATWINFAGTDTSLSSAVSTEVSDRASADLSLSTAIFNVPIYNDSSLSSAVSAEVSDRISGDTSLSVMLSNTNDFTTNLAVGDLLFYDGTTISGTTNLMSTLSGDISTETSDRISADESLSTIVSVVDDMTMHVADGDLLYLNFDTISGTTNLFPTLSTSISTEASDRTSADESLTSLVSTEVSVLISVDSSLSTVISNVRSNDTSLSVAISNEVSNRGSADISLSISISTNISSSDSSLSTAVSGNISSGNVSLSTAISGNISSSDISLSVAISTNILSSNNSLSTAVSGNIYSADQSLSSAVSSGISTEKSERISSDVTFLKLSGGTMVGTLNMGINQIIMSGTPLGNYYLANKLYVDSIAQGVAIHAPVHVVATGVTTLSGATTIDGHAVIEGEFVLVAGQSNAAENGIYVVHSGATAWTRRPDADGNPTNEIELGDFVFVQSGATQASTGWAIGNTDAPTGQTYIIPGVNTQLWFKMAAPGTYSADGQGIELNGTVFSIELSGSTLFKDFNGIRLADGLSTAISSNTSNVTSLSTSLSTEVSNRISGDTSLSTILASVDDWTSHLSNGELLYYDGTTVSGSTKLIWDNTDLKITGNTISSNTRKITKTVLSSGPIVWDMNVSCVAQVTLSGNSTFTINNAVSGDNGTLIVIQDSGGTLTLGLPSGSKSAGGSIVLSTAPYAIDLLSFFYDGSTYFWNIGKNYV